MVAESLVNHRLFKGFSKDELTELLPKIGGGAVKRFAKGEVVVYEGTKAKWIMPVLSGRLNVYDSGESGNRRLARTVEPGQCLGATMFTGDYEYFPGMATAAEASEVVFLDIVKIRALQDQAKYRRFFDNLFSLIAGNVLDCWQKLSLLSCRRAEDRVMLALRWRSAGVGERDFFVPFDRSEDFANYLGLTRTALSLAVSRLVRRGVIAHPGKGHFVIL